MIEKALKAIEKLQEKGNAIHSPREITKQMIDAGDLDPEHRKVDKGYKAFIQAMFDPYFKSFNAKQVEKRARRLRALKKPQNMCVHEDLPGVKMNEMVLQCIFAGIHDGCSEQEIQGWTVTTSVLEMEQRALQARKVGNKYDQRPAVVGLAKNLKELLNGAELPAITEKECNSEDDGEETGDTKLSRVMSPCGATVSSPETLFSPSPPVPFHGFKTYMQIVKEREERDNPPAACTPSRSTGRTAMLSASRSYGGGCSHSTSDPRQLLTSTPKSNNNKRHQSQSAQKRGRIEGCIDLTIAEERDKKSKRARRFSSGSFSPGASRSGGRR